MNDIKLLPLQPENSDNLFNRLLVKPIPKPAIITPEGILIGEDIGKVAESGIVFKSCEGSQFKPGDLVQYKLQDRDDPNRTNFVTIGIETYDVVYDMQIISCNGLPQSDLFLFIEPILEMQVTPEGIIMPPGSEDMTQKGRIYAAPDHFTSIKKNDIVEYRSNKHGIYNTISVDGKILDICYERDIFKVNGKVSDFRIIIKIDKAKQQERRTKIDNFSVNPTFARMQYELQYAEVVDMGIEAQKDYPKVRKGDTVIIHHEIESNPTRIIKKERGKNGILNFEYFILDAWSPDARQIFGVIRFNKQIKGDFSIEPVSDISFMKWEFDMLEKPDESLIFKLEFDTDISACHNIYDLRETITRKQNKANEAYKFKQGPIMDELRQHVPNANNKDRYDYLDTKLTMLRLKKGITDHYLHANHLAVCKYIYPTNTCQAIITYKELYPLEILGRKFLIANNRFIIAQIDNMNKITPHAGMVLVKPIEVIQTGNIVMTDQAREKPQTGTIISVGAPLPGKIMESKEGDTVLYVRNSGIPLKFEGVDYLMMKEGIDTLGIITA